jgi:hypothetical protein
LLGESAEHKSFKPANWRVFYLYAGLGALKVSYQGDKKIKPSSTGGSNRADCRANA